MASVYQNAVASKDEGTIGPAAAAMQLSQQNILGIIRQQRAESMAMVNERLSESREELSLRKETASTLKQQADEAKRNYTSDILRAATASPAEQARLREIDRKRKSGEALRGNEIEYASQYHEFKPLVESQSEKLAAKNGLGHIFSSDKGTADDLAARSADAARRVAEAKVEVASTMEVEVSLKRETKSGDEILKEFKPLLDAIEERMAKQDTKTVAEISKALTIYSNSHRAN